MLLMEEFVLSMVQRERLAVKKDVPIMLLMEEFVLSMVQRERLAVKKDVPIR